MSGHYISTTMKSSGDKLLHYTYFIAIILLIHITSSCFPRGCPVSQFNIFTITDTIPIEGDLSDNEKLDIAKNIAMHNKDIKKEILKKFPELTPTQISGFFIQSSKEYTYKVGKGKSISVTIIIGIRYSKVDFNLKAKEILNYCKNYINDEYLSKTNK